MRVFNNNNCGSIRVIVGPMFAGKSEELLKYVRRLQHGNIPYIALKPIIDTRGASKIKSRSGDAVDAVSISNSSEILDYIKEDTKVIIVDEVQFFDKEIAYVLNDLANKGYDVIVAGLDSDFKGVPFESVKELMPFAEKVVKLKGICHKCGSFSTMTQRLINGVPADSSSPTIVIDDSEEVGYETRCRKCHE